MAPVYVDTHAHLYLSDFDHDREMVIETAIQRGIEKILLPNIDSTSVGHLNQLVNQYPDVCLPMMGLHPTSVKENFTRELMLVEQEVNLRHYTAIGEIGIDLHWQKDNLKEQSLAFAAQLDLSIQHQLPVAIHARESFSEILDILEGYKGKGLAGVFHAFTGSAEIARKVTKMGFFLGIGGIVTYKNSTLPEVIQEISLRHLVLETDAPYLAPIPFRGKRNESGFIPYIARAIQTIKNVPLEEVASVTTANAHELFHLH